MIEQAGFVTVKDATVALMRHVLTNELAKLNDVEAKFLLRSNYSEFLKVLHAGLEAEGIIGIATDPVTGEQYHLPPEFWRREIASENLIREQAEMLVGYSSRSRTPIIRVCQLFIEERSLWIAVRSLPQASGDPASIRNGARRKGVEKSPDRSVQPRRRGPKPTQHERICAEMRLLPAEQLDAMLYKQMADRFGAVGSTCEIARKAVQGERATQMPKNSNNR